MEMIFSPRSIAGLQSSSKVVTSITTLGCFILMIKHVRYWAAEGQRWRHAIELRKARVYSQPLPELSAHEHARV